MRQGIGEVRKTVGNKKRDPSKREIKRVEEIRCADETLLYIGLLYTSRCL